MLFNTNENSISQQVIINRENIKTLDTRVSYLETLDGVGDTASIVDVVQVDESNYDNLPTEKTSFYGVTYYQNQILLAYTYGDLTFYGRTVKIERALNDNVLYQKADMINSADSTDRLYIYRVYSYDTLSWSEWYREPSRDEIITIKADIEVNKSNISQNSTDIEVNKSNISQNSTDIEVNKSNISQNSTVIDAVKITADSALSKTECDEFVTIVSDGADYVTIPALASYKRIEIQYAGRISSNGTYVYSTSSVVQMGNETADAIRPFVSLVWSSTTWAHIGGVLNQDNNRLYPIDIVLSKGTSSPSTYISYGIKVTIRCYK